MEGEKQILLKIRHFCHICSSGHTFLCISFFFPLPLPLLLPFTLALALTPPSFLPPSCPPSFLFSHSTYTHVFSKQHSPKPHFRYCVHLTVQNLWVMLSSFRQAQMWFLMSDVLIERWAIILLPLSKMKEQGRQMYNTVPIQKREDWETREVSGPDRWWNVWDKDCEDSFSSGQIFLVKA